MTNVEPIQVILFISAQKLLNFTSESRRGIKPFDEDLLEEKLKVLKQEVQEKFFAIKTENNLWCANYNDTSSIQDKIQRFIEKNKSLGEIFIGLKAWLELHEFVEILKLQNQYLYKKCLSKHLNNKWQNIAKKQ